MLANICVGLSLKIGVPNLPSGYVALCACEPVLEDAAFSAARTCDFARCGVYLDAHALLPQQGHLAGINSANKPPSSRWSLMSLAVWGSQTFAGIAQSSRFFATSKACLRPGSSRSAITPTLAPLRYEAKLARHFPAPPGLQVATSPAFSQAMTSFSPSTTATGFPALAASMTFGRLYGTILVSPKHH